MFVSDSTMLVVCAFAVVLCQLLISKMPWQNFVTGARIACWMFITELASRSLERYFPDLMPPGDAHRNAWIIAFVACLVLSGLVGLVRMVWELEDKQVLLAFSAAALVCASAAYALFG